MTIAIYASGSRGDVQPYVALGKGLREAGESVRLLTSDDFTGLAAEAGLEFRSIGHSIEAMLQTDEWKGVAEGGNFITMLGKMNKAMSAKAGELAAALPGLLEGTDLLISGLSGLGGPFLAAGKLGIPFMQAYVYPLTPTAAFPSPLTPTLPNVGLLNRLSFHLMRQMMWQATRVGEAATRRELKMPRGSMAGPFRALNRQTAPVLYGFSRHVIPRPADWDARFHVTGAWFLDAAMDWQPPAALSEFLQAGPAPVYIGFGSMASREPEKVAALALDALKKSGQRGVMASGWGGLHQTDVPDSVLMIESAPHAWLFPHMAAVVHHGGAGTTAAGMRAGVPSIIVPFFGDQGFWGQRAAVLGVGPQPIPRRELTAERLAQAITQAVTDAGMRQRAAALGEQIRAENGPATAAAIIQSWMRELAAS